MGFLRQTKRFGEVERAIQAYLKHQGRRAEPWMYLLLAVALEVNGRPVSDVHTALGWAGYLARRQGDPFTLIEVADVLILRDVLEVALPNNLPKVTPGELLDTASVKAPERSEPILLSMLLAEKTKDADRMAQAAENLLSLGWPGVDQEWRIETRRRVEALATQLENDGRAEEAKRLLARLQAAEPRDLFLRLTWKGNAGLDLVVEEPLGATARYEEPRTVFGGAITKSGRGKNAESTYSCPLGFDGTYRISVETLYNDPNDPARDIALEVITHDGLADETHSEHSVDLAAKAAVNIELKGGRRKAVLPLHDAPRMVLTPEPDRKAAEKRDRAATKNSTAKAAEALRGSTPKGSNAPAIKPGDESPRGSNR